MPDGKFRDNMLIISFVRFRTWDILALEPACVWNAKGIDIASNAEPVDTSVRWPQLQNKTKKKLQAVKVLVLQKIKSVHRWRCFHMKIWYIKRNVQFLKNEKVWQPATLQPFEAHGQVVPFWKPPISYCLEPGGHGGGKTFRAKKI